VIFLQPTISYNITRKKLHEYQKEVQQTIKTKEGPYPLPSLLLLLLLLLLLQLSSSPPPAPARSAPRLRDSPQLRRT
ncbi:hypothetical protein FQN53_005119, partial [Emmonsiellopsis sp. PD_33]